MPTNDPTATPTPSLLIEALQDDRRFVESVAIPERIWGGNKDRTTVRLCRIAEEGLDAQEALDRIARALKPLQRTFDAASVDWHEHESVKPAAIANRLLRALDEAFNEIGDIDGLAE